MRKIERIAEKRRCAWERWRTLKASPKKKVECVWAWVLYWDVAYHETLLSDFLDKHA